MTTAKRTQPSVLEFDVALATVVVVVAGSVVVVVGAVVGGTVVVVVGATVVVVTGAVVVVVSWAAAVPDRTPSRTGVLAIARSSAVVRRETFGSIRAAYGQWPARQGDHLRRMSTRYRSGRASSSSPWKELRRPQVPRRTIRSQPPTG